MVDKSVNESYAAIDLGSNSFHMIVANYSENQLQIIDRMKEMIRLASGLDKNNLLTNDAMEAALVCLQRFGQRISEIPQLNIRAVGTNTLRIAKNSNEFLQRAHAALGHPIEVIAGREEARLIYQGVTNSTYNRDEQRLVVDIGGGSTELVIGRGFEPRLLESLYMGCANVSRKFFPDGEITAKMMHKAILFARQELEVIESIYRQSGWNTALGSSGTILCINEILSARGWSDNGITATALNLLKESLIQAGHTSKLDFEPLAEKRKPVFAGGVAILCAIFEGLVIERMEVSDGALRDGLLQDLIGRRHDKDIRDQTISALMQRYAVDQDHAGRIRDTVRELFRQLGPDWQLSPYPDLKLLQWAALVHEIGISIAHAQHHRHAGYLLSHSDLPGFSRQEQKYLALLVRAHRRKLPMEELLNTISAADKDRIMRLCILLRLAVLLNRSRSSAALPLLHITTGNKHLKLKFPQAWLSEHPLTRADLATEANYLKAAGCKLQFK